MPALAFSNAPFRRGPLGAGAVGAFALPVPSAPATPNTPSPANGATAYYSLLSWLSAGATKFDVYLDTVTPPVALVSLHQQASASYVPTLLASTTYYWKIVAFNEGGSATGPIWSFTTPAATAWIFKLAGAIATHIRTAGASIHDVLNAAPNTGAFVIDTVAPVGGNDIQIGLGLLDAANLLFGGEIQMVDPSYVDTVSSVLWPVTLIDYTFTINKRRPFGTWTNVSATTIAQYLVSRFAPGFTANHVQAGLPAVSINFDGSSDFMTCLGQLAAAIGSGGFCDVDYAQDVYLALVDTRPAPDPVDSIHKPLNVPSPMTFTTDLSQIRTRVYGKGGGGSVLSDLAAGEVIIPVDTAALFNPAGGTLIAGTQQGGAQTQILTYTGVQTTAAGSLVGPGIGPASAPTVTITAGAGIESGVHVYVVTFVTAAGESLQSPTATITVGSTLAAPAAALTFTGTGGGSVDAGYHGWAYTLVTADGGETTPSPVVVVHVLSGAVSFSFPVGPSGTTQRKIYRTLTQASVADATTAQLKLAGTIADNITTTYTDTVSDASLGANVPTSNTATVQRVSLSAITLGAASVTSRKIYRTAAGGSQLKLLATIPDNTTTTYADSTADASLGANAPTSDTSGLTQPAGQALAGSSTLVSAGVGWASANGGWAIIGNGQQVIRYTGISGNTLTGIPTSGIGAILATVSYNSTITAAPALVGVNAWNGLPVAMAKGSAVAIWVQVDDLVAQANLGALELDKNGNPTDGVREYTVVDGRMGQTTLTATVTADLAKFSAPIVSVSYQNRDTKNKSGKSVYINQPALGPVGYYVIQDVTITYDGPALMPRYAVKASSVKFTLSDLLRRVALTA